MDSYELPNILNLVKEALIDLGKKELSAGDVIICPEKFNMHYIIYLGDHHD
jgi:hypothetical protein